MDFKEMVGNDIADVFLVLEEFGEIHKVNGLEMTILMDGNEMIEREKRMKNHYEGTYRKQILFYVSAKEFGALPAAGREISLDGKKYRVTDAVSEDGIYSISAEVLRS